MFLQRLSGVILASAPTTPSYHIHLCYLKGANSGDLVAGLTGVSNGRRHLDAHTRTAI